MKEIQRHIPVKSDTLYQVKVSTRLQLLANSDGNWDGVPTCVGKTDYFHVKLVCTLLNYRLLGTSAC